MMTVQAVAALIFLVGAINADDVTLSVENAGPIIDAETTTSSPERISIGSIDLKSGEDDEWGPFEEMKNDGENTSASRARYQRALPSAGKKGGNPFVYYHYMGSDYYGDMTTQPDYYGTNPFHMYSYGSKKSRTKGGKKGSHKYPMPDYYHHIPDYYHHVPDYHKQVPDYYKHEPDYYYPFHKFPSGKKAGSNKGKKGDQKYYPKLDYYSHYPLQENYIDYYGPPLPYDFGMYKNGKKDKLSGGKKGDHKYYAMPDYYSHHPMPDYYMDYYGPPLPYDFGMYETGKKDKLSSGKKGDNMYYPHYDYYDAYSPYYGTGGKKGSSSHGTGGKKGGYGHDYYYPYYPPYDYYAPNEHDPCMYYWQRRNLSGKKGGYDYSAYQYYMYYCPSPTAPSPAAPSIAPATPAPTFGNAVGRQCLTAADCETLPQCQNNRCSCFLNYICVTSGSLRFSLGYVGAGNLDLQLITPNNELVSVDSTPSASGAIFDPVTGDQQGSVLDAYYYAESIFFPTGVTAPSGLYTLVADQASGFPIGLDVDYVLQVWRSGDQSPVASFPGTFFKFSAEQTQVFYITL